MCFIDRRTTLHCGESNFVFYEKAAKNDAVFTGVLYGTQCRPRGFIWIHINIVRRKGNSMDEETKRLIEEINSSPAGTFKLFRATEEEPEVEKSMNNMAELASRVAHAREANCLIEVISLRIQYQDLWLRIYFENRPYNSEKREQEFGRLLRQCFKLGLEEMLYDKIHNFNKDRVKAIHGYLIGVTTYEELSSVVAESDGLSEKLAEFVVRNSGEVVTEDFVNQHHNRGDRVYHIPRLLAHLKERPPI
jgi:hypothetical protein